MRDDVPNRSPKKDLGFWRNIQPPQLFPQGICPLGARSVGLHSSCYHVRILDFEHTLIILIPDTLIVLNHDVQRDLQNVINVNGQKIIHKNPRLPTSSVWVNEVMNARISRQPRGRRGDLPQTLTSQPCIFPNLCG